MIKIPILHDDPNAIPVHPNCGRCPALCCNYISTEIDEPTSRRNFDTIRWYLMHPGTRVYCEDASGSWFVQFMSRCQNLRPDNLCGIYETRPQICRDLQPTLCEFALGAGDRWLFTNVEEFERWMVERERRRAERRAKRNAGPQRADKARPVRSAAKALAPAARPKTRPRKAARKKAVTTR